MKRFLKSWLIGGASLAAPAIYFAWLGEHADSLAFGQRTLLIFAGVALTNVVLIPRWPRAEALKTVVNGIRRSGKTINVTVEGRR